MTRLAIFASGRGTNAEAIIKFFKGHKEVSVSLIVSNNPNAGVTKIAQQNNVPVIFISREGFYQNTSLVTELKNRKIEFIVLAGFLWLIPDYLINDFPNKIINIHPALLPKHGGKGMYGLKVHEEVLKSGEKESGITIHYVDENYDEGDIIIQKKCPVGKSETVTSLAGKVQELEHYHYPRIIEKLLVKETAPL